MLFLPYRIDLELTKIPVFTILICFACIFIYTKQYTKDQKHYESVQYFCTQSLEKQEIALLRNISHQDVGNQCYEIFEGIRSAVEPQQKIADLVKQAEPIGLFPNALDDYNYIHSRLSNMYQRYKSRVPDSLTENLAYDPKELNLFKMVSSTFSHGSIPHLIGNLIFFFIFASSVELIVGKITYVGFIAVVSIGTSVAYSYSVRGLEAALPTVGLSGVVMATIVALALMMPMVRIRCFFWFLVIFKVFRIPALILAVWYVGWDLYEMNQAGDNSAINYVAHVSGAFMGALLGLYFLIFRKNHLREINSTVG